MFCWKCGEDNNDRFVFCTGCGANLRSPLPGEPSPAPDKLANSSDKAAIIPPAFASNISYRESKGRSGKYILIAVVGLAFLIIATIVATLVWRQMSAGGESKKEIVETGSQTAENPIVGERNPPSSNLERRPSRADEEFARINAELDSADALKRKADIVSGLHGAESRHPDDYRFTYQEAKLEAMTSKSHHEAFEMLFSAGKKAIEAGKSSDLLIMLQKDGRTSLKRLTDHKEWTVLENALRKNDFKALEVK